MSFAPSAQLSPTLNKGKWEIEIKNASVVWPVNVRPLASVIVPETIMGTLIFISIKDSSTSPMPEYLNDAFAHGTAWKLIVFLKCGPTFVVVNVNSPSLIAPADGVSINPKLPNEFRLVISFAFE